MSERIKLHPGQLAEMAKGGRLRLAPGVHLVPADGGFVLEVADRAAQPADLWTPSPTDRVSVDELLQPPPARDMVLPWLPAGKPAVLSGAGGTAKTSVAMQLLVPAVAGVTVGGIVAERPGTAVVITAEDRRDDMLRHLHVVASGRTDAERALLAKHIVVKDVTGCGAKLTRMVDGSPQVAGDVRDIIDWLQPYMPRFLVLDTLSRLNGGAEDNEGLTRVVEAMDWIGRETGAAVLILHHTGKAQMRDKIEDQYASRGGSALSDNSRSAMHLSVVQVNDPAAPVNGTDAIAARRLVRLVHSKCNGAALVPSLYLERLSTAHGVPRMQVFEAEFAHGSESERSWAKLRGWLLMNTAVKFPTRQSIDTLGNEYGSRDARRKAITWALDHGQLIEAPHPTPARNQKTYFRLPTAGAADE
jgi:hypothetical protein